ncbi:MAG: hypothetical protein K2X27_24335 [Candidatus Obscuribacterales bacterium]|nr:hypothetical protein [Candidatus Obscuribacterales bacterium]
MHAILIMNSLCGAEVSGFATADPSAASDYASLSIMVVLTILVAKFSAAISARVLVRNFGMDYDPKCTDWLVSLCSYSFTVFFAVVSLISVLLWGIKGACIVLTLSSLLSYPLLWLLFWGTTKDLGDSR